VSSQKSEIIERGIAPGSFSINGNLESLPSQGEEVKIILPVRSHQGYKVLDAGRLFVACFGLVTRHLWSGLSLRSRGLVQCHCVWLRHVTSDAASLCRHCTVLVAMGIFVQRLVLRFVLAFVPCSCRIPAISPS